MPLTTEELQEVKQYVLRELPRAMAQDTELAFMVERLLAERRPREDRLARLLGTARVTHSEDEVGR